MAQPENNKPYTEQELIEMVDWFKKTERDSIINTDKTYSVHDFNKTVNLQSVYFLLLKL